MSEDLRIPGGRILPCALEHGITRRQILEALADQFRTDIQLEPYDDEDSRYMAIGQTLLEVDLEIGIQFKGEEMEVFHCRGLTAYWKRKAEEEGYG